MSIFVKTSYAAVMNLPGELGHADSNEDLSTPEDDTQVEPEAEPVPEAESEAEGDNGTEPGSS